MTCYLFPLTLLVLIMRKARTIQKTVLVSPIFLGALQQYSGTSEHQMLFLAIATVFVGNE